MGPQSWQAAFVLCEWINLIHVWRWVIIFLFWRWIMAVKSNGCQETQYDIIMVSIIENNWWNKSITAVSVLFVHTVTGRVHESLIKLLITEQQYNNCYKTCVSWRVFLEVPIILFHYFRYFHFHNLKITTSIKLKNTCVMLGIWLKNCI